MSVPLRMISPWTPLLAILLTQIIVFVEGRECPDTWLKCGNEKCVARMWVCDGDNDCGDFKDEEDCETDPNKGLKCMSTQFQCENFHCIPMKWRCDGEHDCEDNSDEKNCANDTSCDGFRCHDQHCIPQRWKCDGQKDCHDGSDELFCPKTSDPCGDDEFKCSSGSCVNMSKVCDGQPDCIDGSDEGIKCNNPCSNSTCEHECHATPSGIKCLCRTGYELNQDNETCSDINECKQDGFCSQTCTNLPGSYKCSCMEGYDAINRTCVASGDEPLLVFASLKDVRAMKLRSKIYFPIHNAVSRATAVDVDPKESVVYWTEISRNGSSIYAVNLDGTDFRAVISHGLLVPEDLAVDYAAKNLYVTDSGLKQLLVCKSDGSICHVLHKDNIDKPRALALDIGQAMLFWSDWGEKPGIYRSNMDGTERTTMVSTNIRWPNGIAIDHTTNRLYWCDARQYQIEYISLDGTDRKVLLKESVYHPYSLAVFEDTLYWTDWTSFSVDSCNKFTGHKQDIITRENGRHIMGVHVYHPILSKKVRNPCWASLCSHMCLIGTQGKHTCACPPGFVLSDVSCTMSTDSPQVFITVESDIYHVQPEAVGNKIITKLPIPNVDPIGDLAYNWKDKAFYVSNLRHGNIMEVNMSTLVKRELVESHIDAAENLAYDWLGDNLYWADTGRQTVEVLSLKTMSRTVLLSNVTEITDMVLVPERGLMFISVIGKYPHVAVYDMDGSNRKEIATITGFPKSLSIHPTNTLLYWYDPHAETITSVNYMKPSNSKKVHKRDVPHVSSIAVSEKFIYWVESTSNQLRMMHTDDNRSIFHSTTLLDGSVKTIARKIKYFVPKKGTSACTRKNGGCSHICLIKPSGRVCRCPAGRRLGNDGSTCEVEKVCSPSEFKCIRSGKCVPLDYRCDRTPDCDDGSDEEECASSPLRCPDGDYQCRNGRCILSTWKCDSRNDCGDNSDEQECPRDIRCPQDKFSCQNGQCIPTLWRCDGESDCTNGQDEKNCSANMCKENEHRCDHGQCIPRSWICDGSKDCLDGTDELKEKCHINPSCPKDHFRCNNGLCIDSLLVCDHRNDCEDDSDEQECGRNPRNCKSGMFLCDDGNCIYDHEVCDGYQDCSNDETRNCTKRECTENEFYCSSTKRCIPRLWLCDGDSDCNDGADEELNMCYHKPTAPPARRAMDLSFNCKEFTCTSRDCLPWSQVCDGKADCPDNSDEGTMCVTSCGKTNGGCSHLCSPTPKGAKCSCLAGYKLLEDQKTCDDENECENHGVCSQFCNNTKGGFKCSCAIGYFLSHDHRTCKADGGPANLVYLLPDQIRGIELNSKSTRVYLQEEQTDMRGLDFDAADGVFFWSEWKEGTINRYNIASKRNEVLVNGLQRPYYLRWDWLAKNIYYTSGEGSINACSGQGKFCTTVAEFVAPHVNSLELAPQSGVLFWSVWSEVIKKSTALIERCNMDGSGRIVILSDKVYWPSSLTVDNVLQTLYWADVKLNVVEMSDYHGLNRRVVISDGMYYPFSMTMFEDYVYWADWGTDSLIRCNKFTGQDCLQVHKNNVKAETIVVVHKVKQPRGDNPCVNSGCPQMCLQNPTGFSCHCDRNFEMKNGTCVRKPAPEYRKGNLSPACPIDHCKNNGICYTVGKDLRCRCPRDTDGLHCELKTGAVYDYSWVVVLFLGVGSVAVIVLVIVVCRQNRSKIVKLTDSVAVSFRNPRYAFRKRGGLVMDTDDGADVDELMLGKKGAYTPSAFGNPLFNQRPYMDASPGDGDYKRWPSYDSDDSAFVSECQTRDDTSMNNLKMEQPTMTSKDRIVQFLKRI